MDSLIIFVARVLILAPILLTVYLLWRLNPLKRKQYLILLVAGGILSLVLAKLASHLYVNPRPSFKDGIKPLFVAAHYNGFPSDHTLLGAFLGFAAYVYSRRIGVVILVLAVLIGWARVDAGVHHAVDIVASFVITALACWLGSLISRKLNKDPEHHPKQI